jgi:hypothetical protein
VVDEPRAAAPDHEVGVARRAVGVGDERVEPHEPRAKSGVDEVAGGERVEVERAVEVAERDVGAGAPLEQVLDLGVALDAPELGGTSTTASSGAGRPNARASPPTTSSATSTRAPCPAPRNLATQSAPSSPSTTAGSEPPSRRGCT